MEPDPVRESPCGQKEYGWYLGVLLSARLHFGPMTVGPGPLRPLPGTGCQRGRLAISASASSATAMARWLRLPGRTPVRMCRAGVGFPRNGTRATAYPGGSRASRGTSATASPSPTSAAPVSIRWPYARCGVAAHTPSAMVPCQHAVEKPSLCQNNTPKSTPASSGGVMNPPYISAWPRFEAQQLAQIVHVGSSMANTRRAATVLPSITIGGSATMRTVRRRCDSRWSAH